MLLELLASLVLWTGFDQEAKLQVTCASVTLQYGGAAKASPTPVAFWFEDLKYGHTYLYVVPMPVMPNGSVKLEPTEFWLEEIRQQKNLKLRVSNRDYNFDLTGTKKLIDCDGVVVE